MKGPRAARLAAVMVVASLVLEAACGFGADQPTGRPGDTLTAGEYQMVATIPDHPPTQPDRFTNPKAGNKLVTYHVKLTNVGQDHLPIASNYFTLHDSGGIDNPALSGGSSDWALRPGSIAPGQSQEADLWFEMAANLSPTQLVFAPTNIVGWRTRITVNLTG